MPRDHAPSRLEARLGAAAVADVVRRYRAGEPLKALARELGVARGGRRSGRRAAGLWGMLERLGVEVRGPEAAAAVRYAPVRAVAGERAESILRDYADGLPRREIAARHELDVDAISDILRDLACGGTRGVRLFRPGAPAKLTLAKATDMRADWATGRFTQRQLAAEYGVSVTTVNAVVRGKRWADGAAVTTA